MTDRSYTIKETARVSGLTEDTLRYYERIGLVGPIGRNSNGHRRYNAMDLAWIDFLTKMLATGMTLDTLNRYLALTRRGDTTTAERRTMLEQHARRLETDLTRVQETLAMIRWKIQHYDELLDAQKRVIGGTCAVEGVDRSAVVSVRRLNGRKRARQVKQPS
jgi:DNA-binding transcriptional MerR regulator